MADGGKSVVLRSPRYNVVFFGGAVVSVLFAVLNVALGFTMVALVFVALAVLSVPCGIFTNVRLGDDALTEQRWAEFKPAQSVARNDIKAVILTSVPWIRPMHRPDVVTLNGVIALNTLQHYRKSAALRDAGLIAEWAHVALQDAAAPGQPVAGWYQDPQGTGRRFWDGSAWTDQHEAE